MDPQHLDQSATLTVPDLKKVFVETGMIFNETNALQTGIVSNFDFIGVEDYQMALMLISEAKCAQADKYEEEFGEPVPSIGQRTAQKSRSPHFMQWRSFKAR